LLEKHIESVSERRFSNTRKNISVEREHCFESAYQKLNSLSTKEWYQYLKVHFHKEKAADEGGVLREFYLITSQQMLNPGRALFQKAANQTTFQPFPLSYVNEHSNLYYIFAGKFVAKAICDNMVFNY
jgi:E3 ubiquitin-protein ligase NEDD4